jgi:hypothetical protein
MRDKSRESSDSCLVLLLDLNIANYSDVQNEICRILKKSNITARVKGGALLTERGTRHEVEVSSFLPGRGRSVKLSKSSGDVASSLYYFEQVFDEGALLAGKSADSFDEYLGNWPECISISSIPAGVVRNIAHLAASSPGVIAAYRWWPDNAAAMHILWRNLLLSRVISCGVVLADYQGVPLDLITDDDTLAWDRDREPEEPVDGFFFPDDYSADVFPENRFKDVLIPEDLSGPLPPRVLRTPLQYVLEQLGKEEVLRLGGKDDPTKPGVFTLPDFDWQYPDVGATERRLLNYCLDRKHKEQKWKGFYYYGWGTEALDPIKLAGYICSALLGPFVPESVGVTADGAIQFSLHVLVPSAKFVYMPVLTAWISEPGRPLRLTTAHVSPDYKEYAMSIGWEGRWEDIDAEWGNIVRASVRYGQQVHPGVSRAIPQLYVQRMGRANMLLRRLVRQGLAHGNYSRAPLGRTALVLVSRELDSWPQAARGAAFAQSILGILGVRAINGTWVD